MRSSAPSTAPSAAPGGRAAGRSRSSSDTAAHSDAPGEEPRPSATGGQPLEGGPALPPESTLARPQEEPTALARLHFHAWSRVVKLKKTLQAVAAASSVLSLPLPLVSFFRGWQLLATSAFGSSSGRAAERLAADLQLTRTRFRAWVLFHIKRCHIRTRYEQLKSFRTWRLRAKTWKRWRKALIAVAKSERFCRERFAKKCASALKGWLVVAQRETRLRRLADLLHVRVATRGLYLPESFFEAGAFMVRPPTTKDTASTEVGIQSNLSGNDLSVLDSSSVEEPRITLSSTDEALPRTRIIFHGRGSPATIAGDSATAGAAMDDGAGGIARGLPRKAPPRGSGRRRPPSPVPKTRTPSKKHRFPPTPTSSGSKTTPKMKKTWSATASSSRGGAVTFSPKRYRNHVSLRSSASKKTSHAPAPEATTAPTTVGGALPQPSRDNADSFDFFPTVREGETVVAPVSPSSRTPVPPLACYALSHTIPRVKGVSLSFGESFGDVGENVFRLFGLKKQIFMEYFRGVDEVERFWDEREQRPWSPPSSRRREEEALSGLTRRPPRHPQPKHKSPPTKFDDDIIINTSTSFLPRRRCLAKWICAFRHAKLGRLLAHFHVLRTIQLYVFPGLHRLLKIQRTNSRFAQQHSHETLQRKGFTGFSRWPSVKQRLAKNFSLQKAFASFKDASAKSRAQKLAVGTFYLTKIAVPKFLRPAFRAWAWQRGGSLRKTAAKILRGWWWWTVKGRYVRYRDDYRLRVEVLRGWFALVAER